ncbi:methyltetrahydrofolate cobalamin methyltransferase [Oscillospiraceae bacterium WX1]
MIIIGEKLNGTIPSMKKAILARDEQTLRDLAKKQADAGAHFLDVCASTSPEIEVETLKWMIDVVQDTVDTPICIDSPNIKALEKVIPYIKRPGLINSVAQEGGKCNIIFPLIKGTEWQVIAQTTDDNGIPNDSKGRVAITKYVVETAAKYDITPDRIHIDPLITAISADNNSVINFADTVKEVKAMYPTIKITAAISNISFGMPLRKVLNQHFYALAAYIGLDSAVMDPCNRDLYTSMLVTETLLGRDRLCRKFTNAYRKNEIGPVKVEGK